MRGKVIYTITSAFMSYDSKKKVFGTETNTLPSRF